MAEIKTTFIQRTLAAYMKDVSETIAITAKRAGVEVTGDAIRSLSYQAMQLGEGGTASLSFKEYLRFVDMGVGRGHPLGGLRSMSVTLQAQKRSGKVLMKSRIRKPKKVYSKVAYGKLTWLQNQLLYGYTEETINALKAELQNQNS